MNVQSIVEYLRQNADQAEAVIRALGGTPAPMGPVKGPRQAVPNAAGLIEATAVAAAIARPVATFPLNWFEGAGGLPTSGWVPAGWDRHPSEQRDEDGRLLAFPPWLKPEDVRESPPLEVSPATGEFYRWVPDLSPWLVHRFHVEDQDMDVTLILTVHDTEEGTLQRLSLQVIAPGLFTSEHLPELRDRVLPEFAGIVAQWFPDAADGVVVRSNIRVGTPWEVREPDGRTLRHHRTPLLFGFVVPLEVEP